MTIYHVWDVFEDINDTTIETKMKYKLLFLFFFTCLCGLNHAQIGHNRRMISLLGTGKYFDARDFNDCLKRWGDTLDAFHVIFYKYHMANFQNKQDSAAFYLEDLLQQGHFRTENFSFYYNLWNLYTDALQDYDKALNTCDKVRVYLERNPDGICEGDLLKWKEEVAAWENRTRQLAAEPLIRIRRDNSKNTIALKKDKRIASVFHEAIYNNGNRIKTVFDTGVTDYFCIDKGVAEKIGVRKRRDSVNTIVFNGMNASGYMGILDSVRIANIRLYNIPVTILDMKALINAPDTASMDAAMEERWKYGHESIKVFLGLKTMKLIGRIVIDWRKQVLRFPSDEEKIKQNQAANAYLFGDNLFTRINLNGVPVTVYVDTGDGTDGYVKIDSWFYEKNKRKIVVDSLAKKKRRNEYMLHGSRLNMRYEIVRNPIVTFKNRTICPKRDNVYILSLLEWDYIYQDCTEGVIGYHFFRNLGKEVLFDFHDMRIDVLR